MVSPFFSYRKNLYEIGNACGDLNQIVEYLQELSITPYVRLRTDNFGSPADLVGGRVACYNLEL